MDTKAKRSHNDIMLTWRLKNPRDGWKFQFRKAGIRRLSGIMEMFCISF